VITKIFNLSLESANINPIPNEAPLTECAQLRPMISLTNVIMRLFEKNRA
jgi:hypothetical protein